MKLARRYCHASAREFAIAVFISLNGVVGCAQRMTGHGLPVAGLLLPPRQAFGFPAGRHTTMPGPVGRPLEAVCNVVGVRNPAACAASAAARLRTPLRHR